MVLKMCHACDEKRKTANNEKNRSAKLRKKIKTLREKETYKYLVILGVDTIQQAEMKEKITKEFFRTRKLFETKLSSRNLTKGMNPWTVPLVRYSGPFLN